MGETILSLLAWIEAIRYIGPFVRWIGMSNRIRGWATGNILVNGFEFCSNRAKLDQLRDQETQLRRADAIDAAWASGIKAAKESKEIHRIRRLILPDPDSDSFKWFVDSLPSRVRLRNDVLETTRLIQDNHASTTKIRWSKQFVGASFMIGDSDQDSGWLHFEIVMAFCPATERPRFNLLKRKDPVAFSTFLKAFNDLWGDSLPPDDAIMKGYRANQGS